MIGVQILKHIYTRIKLNRAHS